MVDDRGLFFGNGQPNSEASEFANNRAYVIGVNDYSNGIPPLRTAVADAQRLGELLEESHGYRVRCFPRDGAPSLSNLRELLRETLPKEVGADDRVLFYYAGHGIALDGEDGPEGFLVPEDANREERSSFLAMTELHDALAGLPCRHVLLVLDCCFAGAFRWSSTRDLSALPSVIHRERYDRFIRDPAWQVLTSAAHDQKALDVLSGDTIGERVESGTHSPFAAALFRALQGDADLVPRAKDGQPGGDGVITATELYLYLRECVETATEEQKTRQTPGLWPLRKHGKGEYILLTPGHELNLPPAPELNYENNPYRGLQSFEEEHRELFFGRTRIIEELQDLVSSNPLTVVLGASGTGKSSVVKAGLLPRLRSSRDESWHVLPPIRPGKSPLATLASLTLPGEETNENETERLALLRTDENAWAERIEAWAASDAAASRLLVTVDQFEELVTLCWDGWERDHFIELLAAALRAQPDRFRLIVTIRSDFEPQFFDCPLKTDWTRSRYVVPAMSTDDLREAIEGPASVRVLYFEPPDLVDRLIDDVIQTPGAMPLLSFTLSELYIRYLERRGDDRCLTLTDYQELDGVAGSLRSRATELYKSLGRPSQATMQRIMLRMVSAQGGELARRRVPKSELVYPSNDEKGRAANVINQLSEARLVVEGKEIDGDPFVEPAHDALIRGWDKLLQWTRDEQEELTLRRLLTPAANDWNSGTGGLWHFNPRLALLRSQLPRHDDDESNQRDCGWLNESEATFVKASLERRQNTIAGIVGSVAAAFLALSLLTWYAFTEQNRANQNAASANAAAREAKIEKANALAAARVSEVGRLAALSQEAGLRFPERRILLAIEAANNLPTRVAEQALRDALANIGGRSARGHEGPITCLAVDPSGRWLITGSEDKTVRIWHVDAADTGKLSCTLRGHEGSITCAAIGPNGRWLVTGSYDKTARLWDLHADDIEKSCQVLRGHDAPIHCVAIGANGRWIATGSGTELPENNTVRLWDLEDSVSIQNSRARLVLRRHKKLIYRMAIGPNGRWLVTASWDGTARLWDLEAPVIERSSLVLSGHEKRVYSVAFGPKGRWLVTGGYDNTARLWDLSSEQIENSSRVLPNENNVTCLAIDPKGRWLVTAGWSDTAQLWDLESEEIEQSSKALRGHGALITSVAIGPQGRWLVTGSSDKTARLWDLEDDNVEPSSRVLRGHEASISSVAIDPSGRWLITGSGDNTMRLWDLEIDAFEMSSRVLRGGEYPIHRVRIGPKGRWLVIGSEESEAWLWDLESDKLERSSLVLQGHKNSIEHVAVGPQGRWLVTGDGANELYGGGEATIRLWDLQSKAIEKSSRVLSRHKKSIGRVAFAPKGRWLVTTSWDGTARLWDLEAKVIETSGLLLPGHAKGVSSVAFASQGRWLVTGSLDNTARLWDLESEQIDKSSRVLPNENSVTCVAIDPKGRWLVTAGWSDTARLWDLKSKTIEQSVKELRGHKKGIYRVAFDPQGRWLVTGTLDNTVELWDLQSKSVEKSGRVLRGQRVAFGPKGRWLVTGSRLWDLRSDNLENSVRVLRGHTDGITCVAYCPNGRWLVTGSGHKDKTARLWDLESERVEKSSRVLHRHGASISSVAFDPKGRWLVTGSRDKTAGVWNLQIAELIKDGRIAAGRELTSQEREQYLGSH